MRDFISIPSNVYKWEMTVIAHFKNFYSVMLEQSSICFILLFHSNLKFNWTNEM
jgi:hypothetical protein